MFWTTVLFTKNTFKTKSFLKTIFLSKKDLLNISELPARDQRGVLLFGLHLVLVLHFSLFCRPSSENSDEELVEEVDEEEEGGGGDGGVGESGGDGGEADEVAVGGRQQPNQQMTKKGARGQQLKEGETLGVMNTRCGVEGTAATSDAVGDKSGTEWGQKEADEETLSHQLHFDTKSY